jgi:polyisoprenoid-binding protein YceI
VTPQQGCSAIARFGGYQQTPTFTVMSLHLRKDLMGDDLFVPAPSSGTYDIDPIHTFVIFSVRHLIFGKVRGRFDAIKGDFDVSDDRSTLFERFMVEIDAQSIDTQVSARDADLRSERFFNVAKYPTISIRGMQGCRDGDDRWKVDSDITICGLTRSVPLLITLRGFFCDDIGNTKISLAIVADVKRTDFGLVTDLRQESGANLSQYDVEIQVDVEAYSRTAGRSSTPPDARDA